MKHNVIKIRKKRTPRIVTVSVKSNAAPNTAEKAEGNELLSDVIVLNAPADTELACPMAEEPQADTLAPAEKRSAGRTKKEDPAITRKQVPFYFLPQDHENFRILCFRLGQNMTDFGVGLVVDAMEGSFRCRFASCGCEFVVRTKTNVNPSCPACGSKSVDHIYRW